MSNPLDDLLFGAAKGEIPRMQQALRLGACIDEPEPPQGGPLGNGYTALQYAAQAGERQAFEWLLDHGASLTAGSQPVCIASLTLNSTEGQPLWERALAAGAPLDRVNERGDNLLHMAAMQRRPWAVTDLLARGFDPNARNHEGQTPMHLAAYFGNSIPTFLALLRGGADIDAQDNFGCRPIHRPAARQFDSAVLTLVALGASTWGVLSDNDFTNQYLRRRTPLQAALEVRDAELLMHVLEAPGMEASAVRAALPVLDTAPGSAVVSGSPVSPQDLRSILTSWLAQHEARMALNSINRHPGTLARP